MSAFIEYLDFHAPAETITIADVLGQCEISPDDSAAISKRLLGEVVSNTRLIQNLDQISTMYCGDRSREAEEYGSMLDVMFDTAHITPSDISYVIYTRGDSISRGDPWDLHSGANCVNVPYHIQQKKQLKSARVFNVEQECSGSFVALELARAILHLDRGHKILILSSNYFEMSHRRLMGGSIFVGDGQGLMVVGSDGGPFEILDGAARTDGSINSVNAFLDPRNQKKIVETGAEVIRELLSRNSLDIEDISSVIPLNTSQFSWLNYSRELRLPMRKVFSKNFGRGGHLGDVDLIRNLRDLGIDKERPEGLLLAYAVATGTSWSALLLRSEPRPGR
jgi:3-oxoacyl-[acyl-carrier-protein] synthase III